LQGILDFNREDKSMKFSHISVIAIIFLVISVSIAGCTSSSPTTPAAPATGGAPASGTAAPTGGSSSAPTAGSDVTGANIFGTGASYNWIEYKMVTSGMTAYMKFEKSGKCTMRMESADLPNGGMTIDCTSKGQTSSTPGQSNPANVKSDMKFTFVGLEPVTVGAGTYPTATKYMITTNGEKIYYWTAPGVPTFVKFLSPSKDGDVVMELNGWG
jgi:hypothetical protein